MEENGKIGDNTFQGKMLETFPEGTVILSEGEVNLDMYKIIKGNAELYTGYGTDKEVLLGIIGPGSCFGELGLLLKKPSIYTVVAYSDIYAVHVTEGRMGDFIQENHSSVIQIMKNMANTMITMQRQIEQLSDEINGSKDMTVTVDNKTVQKELLRSYSVYNPRSPHVDMTPKMRFLNRDK